ncbi:MAG TPA: hypothetical protein VFC44_01015 [Candidatus Saccharimonadales bacterium]|nr:hypothetical protein [Candidatus Saccharimonadales bacterium]
MNKRNSDWYISPDWLWGAGPLIMLACISLLGSQLLTIMAQLQTADIRTLYGFGLGAGVLGAILLFVARLPLYKQRRFWVFGPRQLDRKHRRIYWVACILVAVGLLWLGVVWLRTQGN